MAIAMTLTHIAILALYLYTVYCTFYVLDIPFIRERDKKWDVGQLKYLTVWNVIAQTFFFFVCLLNDIFGTNSLTSKKRPFIRRFKDFYHAAIGFPVSMFVGLTFWGLMFVDRELVLPKALDPYFPWWLNHLMHTLIMITTVLEMLIAPRNYPKRSKGIGGLAGFMLTYLAWMHFVYYKSGVWAYPVIDVLSVPLRIVFYLVLLVFTLVLYFAGEGLDRLIWGSSSYSVDKSNKKRKQK
ncbi:androgen-dependent TFPI-regulating protein-like isoform X2 [Phymastichus coffea]|uniref:androgen-dependent TFPI-regulating protein-like isoform X2 n=1 Tax=Phymastichus coffea TaxID=108790 RepID=UPI00273AB26A|nr:androgen-dependent TFPI-regulating protein-like isoform X2 [Phymastichus coffea]XP_058799190.1 androgen-dependent TFPI-regulating protein-like isoform X2 [Phymastichus coffea]